MLWVQKEKKKVSYHVYCTFMRGCASASLSFLSGSCTMAMNDVAPDSLAIILAHRKKPFHSPSDVHTLARTSSTVSATAERRIA